MILSLHSPWEHYFEGTLKSGAKFGVAGALIGAVSGVALPAMAICFAAGWGVVVVSKIVEAGLEQLAKKFPDKTRTFRMIRDKIPYVFSLALLISLFAVGFLKIIPVLVLLLFVAGGITLCYGGMFLGNCIKKCLEKR